MRPCKIVSFSVVIFLVTVLLAGAVTVPAAAVQPTTMQYRYNAAHTGDYSPIAGNTLPNGKLEWNVTIGNGGTSPVVADGTVYALNGDGVVYALDANTGSTLWKFATGSGWSSSPAVANGVVYVGSNDTYIYALDAHSGAKLWSYQTSGSIHSSPSIDNGVVYIGTDGPLISSQIRSVTPLESLKLDTYSGGVYALDARTGQKLWNFTTNGRVVSSSAVVNGVIYFGDEGNPVGIRPYTSGGYTEYGGVYFGQVYALNATTGQKLWNYTTGGMVWSSPAVLNDVVYIGSSDRNVYALNAWTGGKLWNYTTESAVISSPAIANGVVYIASEDRNFYALNSASGTKLWSYIIGNLTNGCTPNSSPAVADGVVYATAGNGDLYAFEANNGMLLWSYQTGINFGACPAMAPSPVVANGILYNMAVNGNVYALSNSTTAGGQSGIPGFEVAFAVIGLLIAYVIIKRH